MGMFLKRKIAHGYKFWANVFYFKEITPPEFSVNLKLPAPKILDLYDFIESETFRIEIRRTFIHETQNIPEYGI